VGKTHIGQKRLVNQDALFMTDEPFFNLPNLYIVADGMGGHLAGEVASTKSIEFFKNYIERNAYTKSDLLDFFLDATIYANAEVLNIAKRDPLYSGMGTTFTALTIKDNKGYIAHVGDSRIYTIYDGTAKALTTDHSYVQEMLRQGNITEEESLTHPRKNVLTRALGIDENILVDAYVFNFEEGDIILMCTDGLTNMIDDGEIAHMIQSANSIDVACQELIDKANENGGMDNITTILLETAGDRYEA